MMEFMDLKVWQKARTMCVEAYRISELLPPKERFRLTDQICRAAVSTVNNIAEGYGRGGGKDLAYHLRVARGSANEIRCCALVACDLKYLLPTAIVGLDGLALETHKMLSRRADLGPPVLSWVLSSAFPGEKWMRRFEGSRPSRGPSATNDPAPLGSRLWALGTGHS